MALTKKQALKSKINYPLSDETFETALIEAGIDGEDNFTAADAQIIDTLAAGLILVVVTSANESEGGYSISIGDRTGLLKIRSLLLSKWDLPDDSQPKIRDATNLR